MSDWLVKPVVSSRGNVSPHEHLQHCAASRWYDIWGDAGCTRHQSPEFTWTSRLAMGVYCQCKPTQPCSEKRRLVSLTICRESALFSLPCSLSFSCLVMYVALAGWLRYLLTELQPERPNPLAKVYLKNRDIGMELYSFFFFFFVFWMCRASWQQG